MMGALLAFSYFNLFGKTERNTKIFMGDSGSLFLGFILGFLSVKCAMDNPIVWSFRQDSILVPLTLLFVPVADVVRVTFHRLYHQKPLFLADKNHIHHKLMRLGWNQHQALIAILMMSLCYIGLNGLLYTMIPTTFIVVIDIFVYCALNICINLKTKVAT